MTLPLTYRLSCRLLLCGLLLCGLLLCPLPGLADDHAAGDTTGASVIDAAKPAGGRNVILIIGDGMDEQQITIARNYLKGAAGKLLLDDMPLRSAVHIQTIEDSVNGKPVYVADSANTATTLATGTVTSIGRIGTSAGDDRDLATIIELAAAAGLRTGIATTSSVTDATPASFAAHVSLRLCENPTAMLDIRYRDIPMGECPADLKTNGGRGSIAEQLAQSPLDVLLGGGADHFSPTAEGETRSVADMARGHGFAVVTSAAELDAAAPGGKLLGLFAPKELPVRLRGENDRTAESPRPSLLQRLHPYLGSATLPEPMLCEPNPAYGATPTLRQMTEVALNRLGRDNDRGFFLLIESASIDKQAHERKACGSIGEVEQLEEALASALAFAGTHPNTLVMVTADHAQAAQLVPYESLFAEFPIPIYTPGKVARIRTPEGGYLAVNYATNNFVMEEHTGAAVPLFGNSEALGRIPPFVRQADIFTISREYLGL